MIVNLPGVKDKTKEERTYNRDTLTGTNPVAKHLGYTPQEITAGTIYLHGPKEGLTEQQNRDRLEFSYNNCVTAEDPFVWYGTEHFSQKLKEYADEVTDRFSSRQETFSKLSKRRADKTHKDPLEQRFTLSLKPEEVADLDGDRKAIAERLRDLSLELIKQYTNKKEICNDYLLKVHLDTDNPHCHIRLGYYSWDGQPLRIMHTAERLKPIQLRMEHDKRFPFLLKIVTQAWEKQNKPPLDENGSPIIQDEQKALVEQITSILAAHEDNPAVARRLLINAGITTTPIHVNNTLKNVEFERKGLTVNQQHFADKKTLVFKHVELKAFHDTSKIDPAKAIPLLAQIFEKNKGQDLYTLASELDSLGWKFDPNFSTKKNSASGYSFIWKDTNSKLKAARLPFNINDYVRTPQMEKELSKNAKQYVSQFKLQRDGMLNVDLETVELNGITFKRDARTGKLTPVSVFTAKARRKRYEKWEMQAGETLEQFIERMKDRRAYISLLRNIEIQGNIGINKHNHSVAFERTSDTSVLIKQNNDSSIDSALQVLLAGNQLTDEEKKAGLKLSIRVSGGSESMRDRLWIKAKLMGIEVTGHVPSKAAQMKVQEQLDNKLATHRQENKNRLMSALDDYKSYSPTATKSELRKLKKLHVSYHQKLDVDVDRRAVALAYVDAWMMGINPNLIMNPPQCFPSSRNKALEEDLIEHYDYMLNVVSREKPDLLDEFKAQIEQYSPEYQIMLRMSQEHELPSKTVEQVSIAEPEQKAAEQQELRKNLKLK